MTNNISTGNVIDYTKFKVAKAFQHLVLIPREPTSEDLAEQQEAERYNTPEQQRLDYYYETGRHYPDGLRGAEEAAPQPTSKTNGRGENLTFLSHGLFGVEAFHNGVSLGTFSDREQAKAAVSMLAARLGYARTRLGHVPRQDRRQGQEELQVRRVQQWRASGGRPATQSRSGAISKAGRKPMSASRPARTTGSGFSKPTPKRPQRRRHCLTSRA